MQDLSDHDQETLSHANGVLHRLTDYHPIDRSLSGETLSVEALRQVHSDYSVQVGDWHWDDVPLPCSLSDLYCYLEAVTLPDLARRLDDQVEPRIRQAMEMLLGYKLELLQTIGAAVELDLDGWELREDVRYYEQEAHKLDQRRQAGELVDFLAAAVETPDQRGIRSLDHGDLQRLVSWWHARVGAAYDSDAVDVSIEGILGAARRKLLELKLLQRRPGTNLAFAIGVYRTVLSAIAATLGEDPGQMHP